MRQRLGIAEVLIKEPRVVFLDEPTMGLDPDGTQRMLEMITSLSRDKGLTVFFSSHLLDQVQRISDRVGIMLKGQLVAAGPIHELAEKSLGVDQERYTLEQIYMRYFHQEHATAAEGGCAVPGLFAIYRKELEDHFSSTRFTLLFTVILMVSLIMAFMTGSGLKKELEGFTKPSLVFLMLFTATGALFSLAQFVAFFGPLIGLVLGFDAINRERAARTLAKLVAQPIYRDSVINGEFLAGMTVVTAMLMSIILMISGLGLWVLGVVPGREEVGRLALYFVVSVFYVGFWLGLAILSSVLFRNMATSALAVLALWIFLAFFVPLGATLAADTVAPVPQTSSVEILYRASPRAGQAGRVVHLSNRALYGCDVGGARSDAQDNAVADPHGATRAALAQPVREAAPARAERARRRTAPDLSRGGHAHLLWSQLRLLHAPGSPGDLTAPGGASGR
jgi:ABC-2 type transport system permease protein